jgi:DnaA-homolog protein
VTIPQQLVLELGPPPPPTFESFFPGRNTPAFNALRAALQGGEHFIYLWGPEGSGKTHLLHAFVTEVLAGGCRARYVGPGESIDDHAGETGIAADDTQQLDMVGQIALFDLYNRFRTHGGTLVSAGDRPPADLPVREDLRTRLGAGLVLRFEPLSDEEKAAALSEHARQRGFRIAPELIEYLLNQVPRDMGTQMSVVAALDRTSLERKRPITLPLVREVLKLSGLKP